MKFGFVLASYVYSEARAQQVSTSLRTLANTELNEIVLLQFNFRPGIFDYTDYIFDLNKRWKVIENHDADIYSGWDAVITSGTYKLLKENPEITHIGFLPDDFKYNSQWFVELKKLVIRHPTAKAWSVYRSNYTRHHRIIGTDDVDVMMTMHDALGTMIREEWFEYAPIPGQDFSTPYALGGGNTIDVHHAYNRPGERWATSRDYWQNMGVHSGLDGLDCAIDYVGD